jgi:hypothetical protein
MGRTGKKKEENDVKTPRIPVRRLGCLLAGVVFLMGGWTSQAKAGLAYGYAEQTISSLSIAPSISAVGTVTSTSTAGATFNGSGNSSSDTLDAPQVFIGGSPQAPQNFFSRYAPGSPPVSPDGNFTRGDSQIVSLAGPANSASVVSESYLNGTGPANETGTSAITASLLFTTTTAGSLTIGYNYSNDAFVFTSGGGTATARFGFDITIKDLAGDVVFDSSTPATNLTLASPPNGVELISSGTQSINTASLAASTEYSIIFSITSGTSVALPAAVPEPSSLVLVGFGGAMTLMLKWRKRSRS